MFFITCQVLMFNWHKMSSIVEIIGGVSAMHVVNDIVPARNNPHATIKQFFSCFNIV